MSSRGVEKHHACLRGLSPVLWFGIVFAVSCTASAEGPRASLPGSYSATSAPVIGPKSKMATSGAEASLNSKGRQEVKVVQGSRYKGKMRQFRDSKGCLILTNVPERYRNKSEYVEISIHYTPIVVQPQYKHIQSAAQYTSDKITDLVKHYAKMYILDENLVYSVISVESNFDPHAESPAGARGLMQLMPGTADDMGVKDIFDPAQNIAGGTQYLAKMLNLFDNNVELALAAYNAGPNAVKEYGGIPPFPETQNYVKLVMARMGAAPKGAFKFAYAVKTPKPKASALPADTRKAYTIYFRSGYTQRAEKVLDEEPYYYVQYDGRSTLIRKSQVEKIEGPA